ncbi:hypothetical protein L596_021113 [Steinernema carpocapsae]|uniref:Uncharacterized protein n=1 Tax=Steinernema carpocapsae TaxID=34508 RepID=A0A4U5MVR9_STECR|nr:hypothetical protein L596_021113 [Steinernema carpocapsae]
MCVTDCLASDHRLSPLNPKKSVFNIYRLGCFYSGSRHCRFQRVLGIGSFSACTFVFVSFRLNAMFEFLSEKEGSGG